jgi:hypothetical protein
MSELFKKLKSFISAFFKANPKGTILHIILTQSSKLEHCMEAHDFAKREVFRRINEKNRNVLPSVQGREGSIWVVEDLLASLIHHHSHILLFCTIPIDPMSQEEIAREIDKLYREQLAIFYGSDWDDQFLKYPENIDGVIKGGVSVRVVTNSSSSKLAKYLCKEVTGGAT